MEVPVHLVVPGPAGGDRAERERLVAAEGVRARELAEAGIIDRLWRIPGRWANWGLWVAPDATALHAAIASLPLYPWLSVDVHPLAEHPSAPQRQPGRSR